VGPSSVRSVLIRIMVEEQKNESKGRGKKEQTDSNFKGVLGPKFH
jgi:hypothetical protein